KNRTATMRGRSPALQDTAPAALFAPFFVPLRAFLWLLFLWLLARGWAVSLRLLNRLTGIETI
ncbi:MAG: hypothetical protein ABFS37_06955, partial [Acidobacteriota bacterium]